MKEIGADVNSEGLKETPLRAAKAMVEMTEGSMCAMARGVRDPHSNMKVNVMHGAFSDQ